MPFPPSVLISYAASFLLLLIGLFLGSQIIAAFGFFAAAVGGGFVLWTVVRSPQTHFSVCTLFGSALAISYCLGTSVSLLTASESMLRTVTPLGYFALDTTIVAALFVLAMSAVLLIFGLFERRFWHGQLTFLSQPMRAGLVTLAVLTLIVGLQILLMVTGIWSFGRQGIYQGTILFPILTVFATITFAMPALCGWIMGQGRALFGAYALPFLIVALPTQLFWTLTWGRRVLFFQLVLFGIFYLWGRRKTLRLRTAMIVGLTVLPLLAASWTVFSAVRVAGYSLGRDAPAGALIAKASDIIVNDFETLNARQGRNISTRFFVIGYLSTLMAIDRPGATTGGLVLMMGVVEAVPSAILPIKAELVDRYGRADGLINARFGLPQTDLAESFAVVGYADFGWFSIVLMPIVVLGLGIVSSLLLRLSPPGMAKLFILASIMLLFFTVEAPPNFYIVELRNLAIVIALLVVPAMILRGSIGQNPAAARGLPARRQTRQADRKNAPFTS